MISYVRGDLFEGNVELIAHGCNCQGAYGAGVAYAMSLKYPQARQAYIDKYVSEGWKLGDVQFVPQNGKIIANCATQDNYVSASQCLADYNAIKTCMSKVKEYAKLRNLSIGIPKIGAGLAGGNWAVIEMILNDVFQDYDCTVYYLE